VFRVEKSEIKSFPVPIYTMIEY